MFHAYSNTILVNTEGRLSDWQFNIKRQNALYRIFLEVLWILSAYKSVQNYNSEYD